jgi:signal transduction histidine kinase
MELILAAARIFLASGALVAIYVDPTEPTRYAPLAYFLMVCYFAYSVAMYPLLSLTQRPPGRIRVGLHVVDVLWVAAITTFTLGPNSPFFVFVTFILLAAAFRWGFWETAGTGIGFVVLFVLQAVLIAHGAGVQGDFDVNRLIIRSTYLVLISLLLGYLADAQKRLGEELRLKAGIMERARVARELHDGVLQSLVGIEMEIEAKCQKDPSDIERLHRIQQLVRQEVSNVRELMAYLKPLELEPNEMLNFLADVVDKFGRGTGIHARFICDVDHVPFAPETCTELARIVQEALTNVRKHSGANNVIVRFTKDHDKWKLVVHDNGRGFDFEGRFSQRELDEQWKGPAVIKERVRLIGGELTLESKRARGSSLEITIPRDSRAETEQSYSHTYC